MSCFKIIFILTKFLLIITLSSAKAKEPKQVTVATVDNHIITAQDVLNATNRLPKEIKEKPLSEIYPQIVNELINQHLITKQAYKDKLDQKQEIINILLELRYGNTILVTDLSQMLQKHRGPRMRFGKEMIQLLFILLPSNLKNTNQVELVISLELTMPN